VALTTGDLRSLPSLTGITRVPAGIISSLPRPRSCIRDSPAGDIGPRDPKFTLLSGDWQGGGVFDVDAEAGVYEVTAFLFVDAAAGDAGHLVVERACTPQSAPTGGRNM